jgi:predicted GNAT family N-acyltransferase
MDVNKMNITLNNWIVQQTAARLVRIQVFVVEQQIPLEMELDETDVQCLHAVATDANGTPIGTGRLLPDGHIGRVAVIANARGTGVGAQILQSLMQAAKARGHQRVVLSSQSHAEGFYTKLGFIRLGEEYIEAGIPHIEMEYCF